MKECTIKGCPGSYEGKNISHMVNHNNQTIIIENVPADVCHICGDTLLSLETVEVIEKMLSNPGEPDHTAPVYEMPGKAKAA
ncbi:MAG: YgiT-type zinc finger protein [Thermodesulfobacteriota bacterium]|nr:YgiT-type zinc finger protein [Thermodesulfobacteriota bacterium]